MLFQDLSGVPENDDWLSAGEHKVLSGLRFSKRRDDWRLGRWTAKRTILEFMRRKSGRDADLSHYEIRAAADGAPEVFLRNDPADVAISISHAGGRGFCAAGPPNLDPGCDIELLEPRGEWLTADYFTPEEIEFVSTVPTENKVLVANLIWSAKESVLKALRTGLRRDTRDITIRPDFIGRKDDWLCWKGLCRQTTREFYGRWRADSRFVYTVTVVE